jgi:uncharacterized membrane protein YkvI
MKDQSWKIAFAYIGVIVGAGLSSGQDLLQYFLCFGTAGLIGVAVLGILNACFGKIMLAFGCYYRADSHAEVFSKITHPIVARLLDVVLIIGSFVMGFVMVAGAGANLTQQFGLPLWFGGLLCSILIIIVSFLDFDKITGVLGIFTPVMIVMILLIAVYSFAGKTYDISMLDREARSIQPAIHNLWLSVINYYALCAMTGVSMAFILGGSVVRIGVAEKGGARGGMLIGIVVLVAAAALFVNIDDVKDADMPMLSIVNHIHPWLATIYAITVFSLIFNTAFSLYFSIARRFSDGDTRKMRIVMIAVVLTGYVCSFLGFKKLIGVMYPILGYMGIVLLIVLLTAWIREHQNIITEKFLRRKMIHLSLKKMHPDYEISREEKKLFKKLGELSASDAADLKKDIDKAAGKIIAREDDVKRYVHEEISVDDTMLRESLQDRIAQEKKRRTLKTIIKS